MGTSSTSCNKNIKKSLYDITKGAASVQIEKYRDDKSLIEHGIKIYRMLNSHRGVYFSFCKLCAERGVYFCICFEKYTSLLKTHRVVTLAGQMPSMVLSGRIWRQEVTNIKTKKYNSRGFWREKYGAAQLQQ